MTVDAWFHQDLMLYQGGKGASSIAKGFVFHLPATEHLPVAGLNRLEDEIRVLLRASEGDTTLQVNWSVGSDYRRDLLAYYHQTEARNDEHEPGLAASRVRRNAAFTEFWQAMEAGQLRREELNVFVNVAASPQDFTSPALLAAHTTSLAHCERVFEHFARHLGGSVTAMGDQGHFKTCFRFLNPGTHPAPDAFDSLASMQENCFLGDAAPISVGTHPCMVLGGHYVGVLTLKAPPQATFPGMMRALTTLPMLDYAITVTARALDVGSEIRKEEAAIEKLENGMRHHPKERMRAAIETHTKRIQRLMSDEVAPFSMRLVIRAWDTDPVALQSKLTALEATIVKLHGAHPARPAFPTTVRNLFISSLPGWTRSRYPDGTVLVEDHHLANLLPVSASSTGLLDQAEALYPGANGNLVGVRSFAGDDLSPQHGLITGMTGAGKSVLLSDILLQMERFYDFTVVVDDGLSHERYFNQVSDQPPIVIRAEGNLTFNYLDTNGLPLSPLQLGDIAGMIGIVTRTPEKDMPFLGALVKKAALAVYDAHLDAHLAEHSETGLLAARAHRLIGSLEEGGENRTLTEAFLALKERAGDTPLASWLREQVEEEEARAHGATPEGCQDRRRLAYAFLKPEAMPTHSDLCDWLESQSDAGGRHAEAYGRLATVLDDWRAGHAYGKLVDGVTTVRFTGRHVHIELSKISNAMPELRRLVAYLVTNYVRSEIMNRPRAMRKRVIFEELGGFLDVPGGEAIVSEFYTRMRKYNAWILSVIQLGKMMQDSKVTASLLGNTRMGIFLRQTDRSELDYIAESFDLPESTREAILSFPEPTREDGAPFVYYHKTSRPVIATARHVMGEHRP